MSGRITIVDGENWTFNQDLYLNELFYINVKNTSFEVLSTDNHKSVTIEVTLEMIEQIAKSYYTSSLITRSPSASKGIINDVTADPNVTDENSLLDAVAEDDNDLKVFSLADLVADCEPLDPIPEDLKDFINAMPVGRELEISEMESARDALKRLLKVTQSYVSDDELKCWIAEGRG